MPTKKRTKAATPRGARRRKSGAVRKVTPARNTAASARRSQAASNGAKQTIRKLKAQLAEALRRIEVLRASADTDFLLDVLNRRGFERELTRSIAYIKRYHASGALVVLDVDRLKPINDAFGHAAGDEVLKAVAGVLSSQTRSSDVIGRLGGDEFAVLLWNLSETDARAKAVALEAAIDGLRFAFRGSEVSAGASAGVALLSVYSDAQTVLEEADRAMYVRKAQRRHEAGRQA